MKRLFSKSNKYLQTMGWCVLALALVQCQNCQDIKSNNTGAYIRVVFFLNSADTAADTVQITRRTPGVALTSGTESDAVDASSVIFALPSDELTQTYSIQGTFTDTETNETKSFNRTIKVDFTRKISVIRPDCGVSEDITITKVTDAANEELVALSSNSIDTTQTEGNVKIFLK
ncbi:hypothetical protein BKI52_31915 [marine bacterium AO1-C]|nr:hypothetical protein BKI52_31915 [marine bacterium AO1-C]